MISFIIPAYNEETLVGRTLTALHDAAGAQDEPYEIIVANDASTDNTAAIAAEHGARVVHVHNRQIAATRNAGAAVATGDLFIFVDADTVVNAAVVRAAVREMRRGAVGGGCILRVDGRLPLYARVLQVALGPVQRMIKMAGGCFFFCPRAAYLAAGRFDETVYCTEEVLFGQKLKCLGRFVILREHVLTSGRKLRSHTTLEFIRVVARMATRILFQGSNAIRQRRGLEWWYETGPRAE